MKTSSFTEEELALIKQYAANSSALSNLGFYSSVIFAPIAFAIYGYLKEDTLAVSVAFIGLLAFVIWMVVSTLSAGRILGGVCEKLIKLQEQNISSGS